MFWNKYPYTDFHELNLDWILARMMELHQEWNEFTALNKITNAGAWDITKQYQAWTIVSDNNKGYISLKPVPAGIAITNTEYWGLIADYDILITDLSNRISALENAVLNLSADEMIIIGDSYAVDASAGGKSWASYVADTFPNAHYNCIGGTGFASDLYITQNFLTMLQGMTIADKNAIKSIFILAGGNDGNLIFDTTATTQDVLDRIDSFCAYCRTNYPNAKIYIGFIAWYLNNTRAAAFLSARDCYRDGALANPNATYIGGLEPIMRNNSFINTVDRIHPTAQASAILGRYALKLITSLNDVYYHEEYTTAFTKDASMTSVSGIGDSTGVVYDGHDAKLISFGTHNNNNDIEFRFPQTNLTYDSSLKLGSFSNTPYDGPLKPATVEPMIVTAYGGSPKLTFGRIYVYNHEIYVTFIDPDLNESNVIQLLIMSPLSLEYPYTD